jgi:CDP-diacylglycerol---glycerol-3-phosphate 3-phosphatidyltransferase
MYNLPLILTVLRMVLTPVFVVLFWQDNWLACTAAIVVFTVAALTDMWDGRIARRRGLVSQWGTFLDPLADKLLIGATFVCFVLKGFMPWSAVLLIFGRDILVTVLRVRAIKQHVTLPTTNLAKAKTVAQFIAIYVIFLYGLLQSCCPGHVVERVVGHLVTGALFAVIWLTVYTGLAYIRTYNRLTNQVG